MHRRTVYSAALWSVTEKWAAKLLTLVTFVILSRLMEPEAFGIVALAMVVTSLLGTVVEGGLADALVQRREVSRRMLVSAFWLSAGAGIVLAGVCAASSSAIASIYGEPEVGPVVAALAVVMVFAGISTVPESMLRRSLDFKSLALRRTMASGLGSIVGVAWALTDANAWALVAQQLTTVGTGAAILLVRSRFVPNARVRSADMKELIGPSSRLLGIKLSSFAIDQSDTLIVGSMFGAKTLGFYVVGQRAYKIVSELVISALSSVALPTFSKLQDDLPKLRRAVLSATEYSAAFAIPTFIGLAVLAPELVPFVFGNTWAPSVPVMQVFCVVGVLTCVTFFDRSIMVALGRTKLELIITTAGSLLTVVAVYVGASWGIVGVACAVAVRNYAFWPIRLYLMRTVVGVSLKAYLLQWLRPLVATIVLAGGIAILMQALNGTPALFVGAFTGATAYIAAMSLLSPAFSRAQLALVRRLLTKAR